jgi:hypothetical protein
MRKVLLALSLALTFLPVAALADDNNNLPPPPTDAQQQQMFKTMETFHAKMEQLHQQMRTQILGSLTAAHREAVANIVGQLAIATTPNPQAAAKQLDAILSQSEQQRILATHESFKAQMKALHEQLRAQMESQMPGGGPSGHPMTRKYEMNHPEQANDAGSILLKTLGGEHMDHDVMFMHAPGPPGPPR